MVLKVNLLCSLIITLSAEILYFLQWNMFKLNLKFLSSSGPGPGLISVKSKQAENGLQSRSRCHGISWTVMDDSWMTFMDDFHG